MWTYSTRVDEPVRVTGTLIIKRVGCVRLHVTPSKRFETPCTQCERLNREDECTGPELSAPFIWGEGDRLSVELWCEVSVRQSEQIHQTPKGRVFIQLGKKSLYVADLKEICKSEPERFDQIVSRDR